MSRLQPWAACPRLDAAFRRCPGVPSAHHTAVYAVSTFLKNRTSHAVDALHICRHFEGEQIQERLSAKASAVASSEWKASGVLATHLAGHAGLQSDPSHMVQLVGQHRPGCFLAGCQDFNLLGVYGLDKIGAKVGRRGPENSPEKHALPLYLQVRPIIPSL